LVLRWSWGGVMNIPSSKDLLLIYETFGRSVPDFIENLQCDLARGPIRTPWKGREALDSGIQ
jgi:hypothetical protein